MTAYLLTEAQHAQIVEAAESNAEYSEAEYLDRRAFWGEALDYRWKNLQEASEQAMATLAMLKALQPVMMAEPKKAKHKIKPKFKAGALKIRED